MDELVKALRAGEQADMDGTLVKVSRQACEEAADTIEALQARVAKKDAEIAQHWETTMDDGGPAFPHQDSGDTGTRSGMTLRDWFAGQALAGIMAGWPANERISEPRAAEISYHAADAMIAERDARREEGTW